MAPVRELRAMLGAMAPRLGSATYVFCTTYDPARAAAASPDATFREAEGLSLILREADARRLGFKADLPMRCITLEVHSALDGVGLTAAVADALAREDIPCNIVAAYNHDHVFVPAAKAETARACLDRLCRDAAAEAVADG